MADGELHRFRYGRLGMLLVVLGMGPTFTAMEVGEERFRVRFSWSLTARASTVAAIRRYADYDFTASSAGSASTAGAAPGIS